MDQDFGKVVWNYKNSFDAINKKISRHENPLFNQESVKQFVDINFEQTEKIKKRDRIVRKARKLQKLIEKPMQETRDESIDDINQFKGRTYEEKLKNRRHEKNKI